MKEGFVYLWFDRKHKRYYVGCHWGTLNDKYICSSHWMLQGYKHRPGDFKRRILKRGISKDDLLAEEHHWLKLIKDEELGKRYYNLHNHHFGHWTNTNNSLSIREKLSNSMKELHRDPAYREIFLEGRKKLPPRTQDQIDRCAASNTGKKRTEETKQRISEALSGRVNGPLSEETKGKLSLLMSGDKNPFFGKTHDPTLKAEMNMKASLTLKGRRPKNLDMFVGTKWWNNGIVNKRSKEYPGDGWLAGRM